MIDTDFLRHLKRLNIMINKRSSSQHIGQRNSVYGGQGLLFKDRGIYSYGDDFRKIDWKVFARTDKLHIKRYEEERNLTVHIIVDSSASMQFGSGKRTKFEYACMIGLGFAHIATTNNEKFVLSTFSDQLEVFKPSKGKKQLVATVDHLKNKHAEGVSRFQEALGKYTKLIKSRSLVIIISDFLYEPEEIKMVVTRFKNSDVKLIQVLDPMELKLNLKGEFKLKDLETKSLMKTFIGPFVRKKYLEKLQGHTAKIHWIADELGVTFDSIITDVEIYDTFYKLLS